MINVLADWLTTAVSLTDCIILLHTNLSFTSSTSITFETGTVCLIASIFMTSAMITLVTDTRIR